MPDPEKLPGALFVFAMELAEIWAGSVGGLGLVAQLGWGFDRLVSGW